MLIRIQSIFSGKMKISKIREQKIKFIKVEIRRKPHMYNILKTLKLNANEQIKKLLVLNLIELSDAEIV